MKGARARGFDGLYVGTGLKQHGANFEQEVTELLAEYAVQAKWALPKLTW